MKQHTLGEAGREYLDAIAYYRDIRQDLGERFKAAADESVARILARPELVAMRPEDYRRLNLHGFPYYVAYVIRGEALWIVAIAHAKRKPKYWIKRLKRI